MAVTIIYTTVKTLAMPVVCLKTEDGCEPTSPRRRNYAFLNWLNTLNVFQYFALIFSLSLRWTWPLNWTRYTSFLFLFNLDLWEFVKVISGAWQSSRDNLVPTSDVPFGYMWVSLQSTTTTIKLLSPVSWNKISHIVMHSCVIVLATI